MFLEECLLHELGNVHAECGRTRGVVIWGPPGPKSHLFLSCESPGDEDAGLWRGRSEKQAALSFLACDVSKLGLGGSRRPSEVEGSSVSGAYLLRHVGCAPVTAQSGGLFQFIPEATFKEFLQSNVIDRFLSKKRFGDLILFKHLL